MAEITVNAKPMEKLPYDPDVIPDAVKRRAEAVNALYSQPVQEPQASSVPAPSSESKSETRQESASSSEPTALPVDDAPTPPQARDPAPQATPTPAETSPSPPPENDDSWKVRYHRMQGQYNASQKTIGEMQEQMQQLGNELLHLQRMPAQPTHQAPQPPVPSYLTEADEQNYGRELLDVAQRSAMHAVAPKFAEIERQNAELQKRLAAEARRGLDQAVELAVPNYREIDRDPRWHNWLLGIDVLSGRVRQQLLNEAIAQAAAPRVVSFFKGFQREEAATGHSEPVSYSKQATAPREAAVELATLAAPGRARPATGGDAMMPTEKPIYTRAQIAKLYSEKRQGAYVGREAEWARLEQDFFTAQREGRYR